MDLHERALRASRNFHQSESGLVDIIAEVDEQRYYIERDCSSLHDYCTGQLGIAGNTAYAMIRVARKILEVPELGHSLRERKITLSNAKRVSAVMTPENHKEWLPLAEQMTAKQLEREVVKARPEEAVQERASYVAGDRVRLEVGLSERAMLKLRDVQALESKRLKRPVSLEEAIEASTDIYLRKKDPVRKAERQKIRSPRSENSSRGKKRDPIPAATLHAVNLRDRGRCQQPGCASKYFTEIHHIKPVSEGGTNDLENLITLCWSHHQSAHREANAAHLPNQSSLRSLKLAYAMDPTLPADWTGS